MFRFWPTTAKTTINRGYKTHSFKQAIHLVVVKQSHSFYFVSFFGSGGWCCCFCYWYFGRIQLCTSICIRNSTFIFRVCIVYICCCCCSCNGVYTDFYFESLCSLDASMQRNGYGKKLQLHYMTYKETLSPIYLYLYLCFTMFIQCVFVRYT